jgi:hypothetical protein
MNRESKRQGECRRKRECRRKGECRREDGDIIGGRIGRKCEWKRVLGNKRFTSTGGESRKEKGIIAEIKRIEKKRRKGG